MGKYFFILLAIASQNIHAEIIVYKCKDKTGGLLLSDKPCPTTAKEVAKVSLTNNTREYVRTEAETRKYANINNDNPTYYRPGQPNVFERIEREKNAAQQERWDSLYKPYPLNPYPTDYPYAYPSHRKRIQ